MSGLSGLFHSIRKTSFFNKNIKYVFPYSAKRTLTTLTRSSKRLPRRALKCIVTTRENMRRKITSEEKDILQTLSREKSFPRWKHSSTGSFLYYYKPHHWSQEVSPNPDGTWSVGQEEEGTLRQYQSLQHALIYGERLAVSKARCSSTAIDEKVRRDDIMLEF
jgi:hypothetical protein